jgi:hypothetical protein
LQAGLLAFEQNDTGLRVRGIGRSEGAGSKDPGLGLDGDMRLVAVAILGAGLVHVASLGVDRRDHPVRCDPLGDPPGAVVGLLDVLARHEGEQAEGGGDVV